MLAGSRERRPDGDDAAVLRWHCLIPYRYLEPAVGSDTLQLQTLSTRDVSCPGPCEIKNKKNNPQSLFLLDGLFLIPVLIVAQPAALECLSWERKTQVRGQFRLKASLNLWILASTGPSLSPSIC